MLVGHLAWSLALVFLEHGRNRHTAAARAAATATAAAAAKLHAHTAVFLLKIPEYSIARVWRNLE